MAESDGEYLAETGFELYGKKPIRVLHVYDDPYLLKAAKQLSELRGSFQFYMALSVEVALDKTRKAAMIRVMVAKSRCEARRDAGRRSP